MPERDNDDYACCSQRLITDKLAKRTKGSDSNKQHQHLIKTSLVTVKYCQHLINNMTRKLCNNSLSGPRTTRTSTLVLVLLATLALQVTLASPSTQAANHNHNHHQNHQSMSQGHQKASAEQLPAQARVGGLDASDYIDEAGELDVLMNQQQIPTAQLMSAAGHIVPENFFMPGGSIPVSLYAVAAAQQQQQQRYLQQQQQQQQQQQHQSQQDPLQQVASQVQARVVPAPARYSQATRGLVAPFDLLMATAEQQQVQHQHQNQQDANQVGSLIDYNGYAMTTQPDPRDTAAQMDLIEFLGGPQAVNSQQLATLTALYEQQLAAHQQQHQQQQHQQPNDHATMVDQMATLASNQQQQQEVAENENYLAASTGSAGSIGPDYQLIGHQDYPSNNYESGKSLSLLEQQQQHGAASNQYSQQHSNSNSGGGGQSSQRPYGLPTKSSSKEPTGMLKPIGNPKTVSSPLIDFAANNLPKNTGLEKLADKLPQQQTPTVFSFASSKDPSEKVKSVNQKKRTVMRQAEQMAKLLIKSFNDKFGTTLGDQTDIPFLLSTLGPLGFAQNILLDPTLLVSLLNTAEKTYFSDVLPAPAKQVIRPVLNIFRVPNKKRDKANLLNIISYLASGGQTAASVPSKHRLGIEKSSGKSKHTRR